CVSFLPVESEHLCEPHRVVRRANLAVVVEEYIHVARPAARCAPARTAPRVPRLPPRAPDSDAARPLLERVVVVTAGVDLLGAVQPCVHEVGRDVLRVWPLRARIGEDEREIVLPQQLDERLVEEAVVAELERVPDRAVRQRLRPAALLHAVIVGPGESRCRPHRARQLPHECIESFRVEPTPRRELPEDRPELVTEPEHARREEVRERRAHIVELFHVRDEAAALQGKPKARRRLLIPRRKAGGSLQRVKCAVDLDRIESTAGVLELPTVGEAARVERAPAPAGIGPAGYADVEVTAWHRLRSAATNVPRVLPREAVLTAEARRAPRTSMQ